MAYFLPSLSLKKYAYLLVKRLEVLNAFEKKGNQKQAV